MSLRKDLGPGVGRVSTALTAAGLARPVGLRAVVQRFQEPLVFEQPLVTADGVALGGSQRIELRRDGHFVHDGHARATGFPSFDYAVRTVLGQDVVPVVLGNQGHVHGTNEIGDREDKWHKEGTNNLLTLHWASFRQASPVTTFNHDTDIFGDVGDVLVFVGGLAAGFVVGGPAGVCIVLGLDLAAAAGAELGVGGLAGVGVAAGVLVIFGPAAIVPAIIVGVAAGVAAAELVKQRPVTDQEFAFADQVFRGTVPRDRIKLTNMIGFGGRPFTMPSLGDDILVNLGQGFDDPVHYTGFGDPDNPHRQAAGQLFIHELTHVWQIHQSSFLPGLLCNALTNQVTTIGGDMGIYQYGPPDRAWSDFNLEQQASIVDDWFAGSGRSHPNASSEESPYFGYIRDNIRAGLT
ncbi:MAG TPA: hypothetical protein VGK53_17720 [Propionicimonas sp.]